MATFIRPTFSQILERVKSDIDSRLTESDSRLRRSLLNVLAYAIAGLAHGLYGFISWVALQPFADTAELEYLNRIASFWGVTRVAASFASGDVVMTGTNGTVIAEETELQRSDGVLFLTTAEATIASGEATVAVEAVIAGEDGNTEAASIFSFTSTPSDVDADVTVDTGGLTGGADEESDAALLARLLSRIQEPPAGGNANDYEQWAKQVAGVTRAWVYPEELGAGGVTVRFMMDETYDDGIPESGDVDDVQDYIDTLRPVTADVTVVAPVAVPLNFTITLTVEVSQTIKDAVEVELLDMIKRDAEPAGTIYLSRINEAISISLGEYDHTMAAPVANVTHTTGQIATMGTVTWG
jgi:uncharacterized phage protein gp47/JayE